MSNVRALVNISDRLQPPIFATYVVWALVLVVHAMVVWGQSEWLANLPSDTSSFVMSMFWGVFGSLVAFGAALAWHTQANRLWARWIFMFLCFAYAVDCLLGTLTVGPLHENLSRPYGIFRGPISFVVWGYFVWLAWAKRPNLAVKRDVPQAARPLP